MHQNNYKENSTYLINTSILAYLLKKRLNLRRYYIYIFLLFIAAINIQIHGQEAHFTQFYANPLYLAPSFAGATEQHRIGFNFRDQWPSVPGTNTFVTYSFAYDHYFSNFNSGVGVFFMNDVAGSLSLSNLKFGLMYSYDFQVFNFWHIRPGATFAYFQKSVNVPQTAWYTSIQSDGSLTETGNLPKEPFWEFDASASVLIYADKIWFGSSVDHLTKPRDAFDADNDSRLLPKVSLFGGYQIIRKGRLLKPIDETVSVAFLYKNQYLNQTLDDSTNQANPKASLDLKNTDQLDLGLYWFKSPLVFGLWYRGLPVRFGKYEGEKKTGEKVGDMLAVIVGVKVPQFSVGYSYDFTISRLVGQTGGAHEISMIYEFKTSRRRKIHAIPCPEF